MTALLFRWRGVLLGALALPVLWTAHPTYPGLASGALLLLLGLLLRLWSFAHLGSAGRTRNPEAPPHRVCTGPYRWLGHPVYSANLLMASGWLLAAAVPVPTLAALLLCLFLFYSVLAWREEALLAGAARYEGPIPGLLRGMRSERSTWITTVAIGCVLGLQGF